MPSGNDHGATAGRSRYGSLFSPGPAQSHTWAGGYQDLLRSFRGCKIYCAPFVCLFFLDKRRRGIACGAACANEKGLGIQILSVGGRATLVQGTPIPYYFCDKRRRGIVCDAACANERGFGILFFARGGPSHTRASYLNPTALAAASAQLASWTSRGTPLLLLGYAFRADCMAQCIMVTVYLQVTPMQLETPFLDK